MDSNANRTRLHRRSSPRWADCGEAESAPDNRRARVTVTPDEATLHGVDNALRIAARIPEPAANPAQFPLPASSCRVLLVRRKPDRSISTIPSPTVKKLHAKTCIYRKSVRPGRRFSYGFLWENAKQ